MLWAGPEGRIFVKTNFQQVGRIIDKKIDIIGKRHKRRNIFLVFYTYTFEDPKVRHT